jgi:hypothetical protein
MPRVEPARDGGEQFRPCRLELLVHQPLRLRGVFEPGEAVLPPDIVETSGVHLPRQPLPAIEAHLDREREPRLDAGVHEPKHRIDMVVVEVQAFAPLRHQIDALGGAVTHDPIGPARLHRAENADQALLDPIGRRDLPGDRLLARRA